MIVEDEPSLRMMLSAAMMLIWGVEPLTFDDGYDAMAWLDGIEAQQAGALLPELALLDIRMPGPQGPEIAERLRRVPATSKIAIVMMTAYRLNSEERESIEKMARPQAMVSKPLPRLSDLKQTLEQAVASSHSRQGYQVLNLNVVNLATAAAPDDAPGQSNGTPATAAPRPPTTPVETTSQATPLPTQTPPADVPHTRRPLVSSVAKISSPSTPVAPSTAAAIPAAPPSPPQAPASPPPAPAAAHVPAATKTPTPIVLKPPTASPVSTAKLPPATAADKSTITFTYAPPYGFFDNLHGRVDNVPNYKDYRVAVYIRVETGAVGWWTKPTFGFPTTPIEADGSWICDITTGGANEFVMQITAFLIPATYSPPVANGLASLPPELYLYPYANVNR